jgi:hypothetical protein
MDFILGLGSGALITFLLILIVTPAYTGVSIGQMFKVTEDERRRLEMKKKREVNK